MREIEIKILEINKKKIIQKLKKLRAKQVGVYDMHTSVFDTPNSKIRKNKQLLRVRTQNKKAHLTFKDTSSQTTVRSSEEYEVEVSDFETMKTIIKKIGYPIERSFYKKRTTFKLKNAIIEIDEYENIPAFLEIEAPSKIEIKKVVELLGYTMKDTTTMNGFELGKHYKTSLR